MATKPKAAAPPPDDDEADAESKGAAAKEAAPKKTSLVGRILASLRIDGKVRRTDVSTL